MKIGDLVEGVICKSNELIVPISVSFSKDVLLSHYLGLFSRNDTIELISPYKLKGIITKLDSSISGYGIKLAQVFVGRRLIWVRVKDIKKMSPKV